MLNVCLTTYVLTVGGLSGGLLLFGDHVSK